MSIVDDLTHVVLQLFSPSTGEEGTKEGSNAGGRQTEDSTR